MRAFGRILLMGLLVVAWPGGAYACIFPDSLRTVNGTMLNILDGGGEVSVHHRDALRRTLGQMDASTLLRILDQEVARRDVRAATAVLATAQALAEGRGLRVEEALRGEVSRVARAADAACSGTYTAATGAEDAAGAEQGKGRQTGQGGRPLTFRESVVRLSLTFTIYMIFLAFLLGIRRQVHEREARKNARLHAEPLHSMDRSVT